MYCELLKPTKNKAKRTGNVKKRTESDPKGPDKKRLKTDSSDSQYDGISLTDSSRSEVEGKIMVHFFNFLFIRQTST